MGENRRRGFQILLLILGVLMLAGVASGITTKINTFDTMAGKSDAYYDGKAWDVDGDGKYDVIAFGYIYNGSANHGAIGIYEWDGSKFVNQTYFVDEGDAGIYYGGDVFDVDKDKQPEIIVFKRIYPLSTSAGEVIIYDLSSDYKITEKQSVLTDRAKEYMINHGALKVADLNGDGKFEIVAAGYARDTSSEKAWNYVQIFEYDGTNLAEKAWWQHQWDAKGDDSNSEVEVYDTDGDGRLEIVTQFGVHIPKSCDGDGGDPAVDCKDTSINKGISALFNYDSSGNLLLTDLHTDTYAGSKDGGQPGYFELGEAGSGLAVRDLNKTDGKIDVLFTGRTRHPCGGSYDSPIVMRSYYDGTRFSDGDEACVKNSADTYGHFMEVEVFDFDNDSQEEIMAWGWLGLWSGSCDFGTYLFEKDWKVIAKEVYSADKFAQGWNAPQSYGVTLADYDGDKKLEYAVVGKGYSGGDWDSLVALIDDFPDAACKASETYPIDGIDEDCNGVVDDASGELPKPVPVPKSKEIRVAGTVFQYYENEIYKYLNDGETFEVGFYETNTNYLEELNYHYTPDSYGVAYEVKPVFNYTKFDFTRNISPKAELVWADDSKRHEIFTYYYFRDYVEGREADYDMIMEKFDAYGDIKLSSGFTITEKWGYYIVKDESGTYEIEPTGERSWTRMGNYEWKAYHVHGPERAVNGNDAVGDDWVSNNVPSALYIDFDINRTISKIVIKRGLDKDTPDELKSSWPNGWPKRVPEDFDVVVSTNPCGLIWTGKKFTKSVMDNKDTVKEIVFDPPIKGRCVQIKINDSWGNGHYPKCSKDIACEAAIDEVEIYEYPYPLRYKEAEYLPIKIKNQSDGSIVGHLIMDRSGKIIDDYYTLWPIFNTIAVLGDRTANDLDKEADYFEELMQKRRDDSEDMENFAYSWGVAERVAIDAVAAHLSIASGGLWGGIGAALSAMNTPYLIDQLYDMSHEGQTIPNWTSEGMKVKSYADLALNLKELKTSKELYYGVKSLKEIKIAAGNTHGAYASIVKIEYPKLSTTMKTNLRAKATEAAASAIVSLMDLLKKDTALDAMTGSVQFAESAIAYKKIAMVLRDAGDGIDDDNETKDIAYLNLLSAYAAKRDECLMYFLRDTHADYLREDWRGWVYKVVNPSAGKQVKEAAETTASAYNESSKEYLDGFFYKFNLTAADTLWAENRVKTTPILSDHEELAKYVAEMEGSK